MLKNTKSPTRRRKHVPPNKVATKCDEQQKEPFGWVILFGIGWISILTQGTIFIAPLMWLGVI